MRDCPSCDYPLRSVLVREYNATSLVNAGIDAPKLSLCQCEMCGMMYVDGGQVDQAWFDNYYLKFYKTDDKPFSQERLEGLAKCIDDYLDDAHVLDIGGTDGELIKILSRMGAVAIPSGVGDVESFAYDAVILSHTLEHIYDIPAMMARVQMALVPGGLLFIEVPYWSDDSDFLAYDNHWQHVNKMRPIDLRNILESNGFEIIASEPLPNYREYNVWRIIGRMG